MSDSSQILGSGPSPEPVSCYKAHAAKNGVYDWLVDKIVDLGVFNLGGTNYQKCFVREVTEKGNYKYIATNDEEDKLIDCHFMLFRQICPSSLGTGTQLSS
jgi:hypothetical protein